MMSMVETGSEPPRKGLRFKVIVFIGIIVIVFTFVFWYFVLPFILKYESLDLFSYYWVANSREEIRQLVITFINNGTQDLTINEVWINEFLVNQTDWGAYFDTTIQPEYGTTVYVVPEDLTFESNRDYNLTLVTSRKNRFNFMLTVDEDNTKIENVTITGCYFYHWPPLSGNKVVGIEVKSLGSTDVIIKRVWIDGASFIISPPLWLDKFHDSGDIEMSFPWERGLTYTVSVETMAGGVYGIRATAD